VISGRVPSEPLLDDTETRQRLGQGQIIVEHRLSSSDYIQENRSPALRTRPVPVGYLARDMSPPPVEGTTALQAADLSTTTSAAQAATFTNGRSATVIRSTVTTSGEFLSGSGNTCTDGSLGCRGRVAWPPWRSGRRAR
jgi:hypothetical protein